MKVIFRFPPTNYIREDEWNDDAEKHLPHYWHEIKPSVPDMLAESISPRYVSSDSKWVFELQRVYLNEHDKPVAIYDLRH